MSPYSSYILGHYTLALGITDPYVPKPSHILPERIRCSFSPMTPRSSEHMKHSPLCVEFPINVAPEERRETSSFLFQQARPKLRERQKNSNRCAKETQRKPFRVPGFEFKSGSGFGLETGIHILQFYSKRVCMKCCSDVE